MVFQAESAVGINRKLREEKADTAEVGRRQADDLIRFFNRCLCQDVSFQITRAIDNYIVCQFAECVQEIFRFCFSELRVSVSVLARAITEKAEVLHLFDRYKVVDDVALLHLRPGQRITDRAKIFGLVKRKQHRNHRCLQVGIECDNSGLEG